MSRSKWKEPFVNEKIINQSLKNELNKNSIDKTIKVMSKNSKIINSFIGLTFNIYTGKTFLKLEITKEMVGYKFGEFIFTRIHSPPKKKKIKRKIAFKKKIDFKKQ